MRSLSENYSESHSNTHETFADLVFCALVVLILFVLALTVEVSQRVRGAVAQVEPVKAEEVAKLTPEEIEALSTKLQSQQVELEQLRSQMAESQTRVKNQLAAMSGEQRFTGAREPAAFSIAFNYETDRYYFVPSKDINDADRHRSGESLAEYSVRKTKKLVEVALAARKQRGYTIAEMQAILGAISQYKTIVPSETAYSVENEHAGIYYHVLLCGYISGDTEVSDLNELQLERAILAINEHGPETEGMYPSCQVTVDANSQRLGLGGIVLSARDLRDMLLSIDGRGLLLDFEGYQGPVPPWLYEEALAPAGYVGKTPKLPND